MVASCKILVASCATALSVGLSACSGGTGASGVPPSASDAPKSSTVGPGANALVGTGPDRIVSITEDGMSVADSTDSVPFDLDVLPEGSLPNSRTEVGDFGYWLIDTGAAFHVRIEDAEASCLVALDLDDTETGQAIEGAGDGWTRAAGCLSELNVAAVDVMRAMDVALADADDEQYVCVESELDRERTIPNLENAIEKCGVGSEE